jgi:CNT family concentrative nucleoside transporter
MRHCPNPGTSFAASASNQERRPNIQALAGIAVILLLAWAVSDNRRSVPLRTVGVGMVLHIILAFLLLKLPGIREAFFAANEVVEALQAATGAGTSVVLGYLGGGSLPFVTRPGVSSFVLAFQALPLVLVISALSALLYHWRVLPIVVLAFAWCLRRTLGLGGTAGVSVAANVFVGMVEAPLLVKPYLAKASRSDLFLIMTAGMATIAGTVLVLYATFLKGVVPGVVGHLLSASVLNAVAAIVIARIMIPPEIGVATAPAPLGRHYENSMDAITRGTLDGLTLLLNITAMLIVLIALVALVNAILGLAGDIGGAALTLQRLLGYLLSPLAWLIGVPWAEAGTAGALMGTKIVLNELIAYLDFARLPREALSEHSRLIMTYALCGFANFGSLGIMLGGLGAMAPERRGEIAALGLRTIASGALATWLTAAIAGLIL